MSQRSNVLPRRPVPHVRIAPSRGWQLIDVRELFAYRDLFLFLVLRDIKVLYKQTVLGFSWAIIRPLFQMILFTVIFGNLARVSSDGVPYAVFSYVALVPWNYFSTSVTTSANSLVVGANMLSKVYFPRMVMPLAPLLAKLVDFAIAFSIVFVLMAIYGIAPTANVVFLPLLLLIIMLTAGGAGLWLAALAVQYRDVKHVMEFLTQILMFAAPVVWPVTLIAERFGETARLAYGLYPMAGAIEGFRSALLGTNPMPWGMIGLGALTATILFVTGAFYFRRMERRFADVA
jgi:lipopolysaccharide transport system permease protein